MKRIILITIVSLVYTNADCYFEGIPENEYWFNIKIRELKKEKEEYRKKWNYEALRNEKLRRDIERYKKYYKKAKKIQKKYSEQNNEERTKKYYENRDAKKNLKDQIDGTQDYK